MACYGRKSKFADVGQYRSCLVIESPVWSRSLTSSGLDRDRDRSTKVPICQKTGLDRSGPVAGPNRSKPV